MDLSFLKNLRTGLQPQERNAIRYGYRYRVVVAHPAEIIEGRALINRSKYRISQRLPAKDKALYVVHESSAFDVYHDTPVFYDPAPWEALKKTPPKWTDPQVEFSRFDFIAKYNWNMLKVNRKIKRSKPFLVRNKKVVNMDKKEMPFPMGVEESLECFREVEFEMEISPTLKTRVYVGRRIWGMRMMVLVEKKWVAAEWIWTFY